MANAIFTRTMNLMGFLFCTTLFPGATDLFAQKTPKCVLVIADGIPADVIERLRPPALQAIADDGAFKRAFVGGEKGTYKETPTISAPGYNDMLTGVWGYKHNVWDNDDQKPNYNYPTIFRLFKTANPSGKTAIFSTWIDNRTVLLGSGLPQTNNLTIDYVFDGFEKDTINFPHHSADYYTHRIDEHVVHCADSVIRKNAPDLSWIYLEFTDDVGHAKGTAAAFDTAIGILDNQMKKISAAIKFRETNFNEKWLLLITTDHGRDSITGSGHGGQSMRERTTWMIMNQPTKNPYFADYDLAIIDILPSVANFLNFQLPVNTKREIDGTPFLGPVSLSDVRIKPNGDSLKVSWSSFKPNEEFKILISYTNNNKTGQADQYQLIGRSRAGKNEFNCKIADLHKHDFFKVVVEGKNNSGNAHFINTKIVAATSSIAR